MNNLASALRELGRFFFGRRHPPMAPAGGGHE